MSRMGFASFFSVDCENQTQTKPHHQNSEVRDNGQGRAKGIALLGDKAETYYITSSE
jgi:hypothetical protein